MDVRLEQALSSISPNDRWWWCPFGTRPYDNGLSSVSSRADNSSRCGNYMRIVYNVSDVCFPCWIGSWRTFLIINNGWWYVPYKFRQSSVFGRAVNNSFRFELIARVHFKTRPSEEKFISLYKSCRCILCVCNIKSGSSARFESSKLFFNYTKIDNTRVRTMKSGNFDVATNVCMFVCRDGRETDILWSRIWNYGSLWMNFHIEYLWIPIMGRFAVLLPV